MQVLVIGAGVIGLTTAIELRLQGHDVEIWAKAISPGTTSDVAAAFWLPYAAFPIESVSRWAKNSFAVYAELASIPEAGIFSSSIKEFFKKAVEPPQWRDAVSDYEEFVVSDSARYSAGFRFSSWVIDMTRHMPYLKSVWKQMGGRVAFMPVEDFDQIPEHYSAIVNCTGLGARELASDKTLIAARGRVVRIAKFANQPDGILLEEGTDTFAMIVPRIDDIVLGGTYEENMEDLSPDNIAVEAIIERCIPLCPELAQRKYDVLGSACGLRPVRPEVRLEMEKTKGNRTIIHNYGHGGAGVTLAWGCAQDVATLVAKL